MAKIVGDWGAGNVWQITTGKFSSNAYFCEVNEDRHGFLVDPGLDGESIDAALNANGLTPQSVYCTHGHFDHVGSANYFQKKYACEVFIPKPDLKIIGAANFMLLVLKIDQKIMLPDATFIEPGFTTTIKNVPLRYLPAPGHTPGSCIIEFGSAWFTGDTLYAQGVGLSKLPGENHFLLKQTILKYWNLLTEDRFIFPGHGKAANGLSVQTNNIALLKFLGLI
jgi:hydroxyacylglutathione hydrolase